MTKCHISLLSGGSRHDGNDVAVVDWPILTGTHGSMMWMSCTRPDTIPPITSSLIDRLTHPAGTGSRMGRWQNVVQAAGFPWGGKPSTDTRNSVCVQMYTYKEMMR